VWWGSESLIFGYAVEERTTKLILCEGLAEYMSLVGASTLGCTSTYPPGISVKLENTVSLPSLSDQTERSHRAFSSCVLENNHNISTYPRLMLQLSTIMKTQSTIREAAFQRTSPCDSGMNV